MRLDMVRRQGDDLPKAFRRLRQTLFAAQGDAQIAECIDEMRMDMQRLPVASDGAGALTLLLQEITQQVERACVA